MKKLEYQKVLDQIIKTHINPIFKKNSFKRNARNYYKYENNIGKCFNIQSSIYNKDNEIKFTFNTGLFIPQLFEIIKYPQKTPDFPKEIDCFHRQRIGTIMHKSDYWYTINNSTIIANLISEMIAHISNYILPHFTKYMSWENILDDLYNPTKKYYSPEDVKYIILILTKENRKDDASAVFTMHYNSSTNEIYRNALMNFAKRIGLQI